MEIVIKSGAVKKRKFRLYTNNAKEIEYLSRRYRISPEKLVREALMGNKIKEDPGKELEELNDEINALLQQMFRLESEWAGLRYRAYLYIKENRSYAISLAGSLAKNRHLRNLLNMAPSHRDISELVDKYLWM